MSAVDRSPSAVAARLRQALALGRATAGSHAKGARRGGEAVRARLRRVAELRELARRLQRRRPVAAEPSTEP